MRKEKDENKNREVSKNNNMKIRKKKQKKIENSGKYEKRKLMILFLMAIVHSRKELSPGQLLFLLRMQRISSQR